MSQPERSPYEKGTVAYDLWLHGWSQVDIDEIAVQWETTPYDAEDLLTLVQNGLIVPPSQARRQADRLSERIKASKVRWVRHYKGGEYSILSLTKHTETDESLVVYHKLEQGLVKETWVRPLNMFDDTVEHGEKQVPRFVEIAGPTEGHE